MNKIKIKCCQSSESAPILILSQLLKSNKAIDIEWGPSTSLELIPTEGPAVNFSSIFLICRYIARTTSSVLYGKSNLEKTEVDHWLEFSSRKYNVSEFNNCVSRLNKCLSLLTYLVGDELTLADICVWSTLYNNKQFNSLLSDNLVPEHLLRWYKFLSSNSAFKCVADMFPSKISPAKDEMKKEKVEDRGKFTDLPGAEMGNVVVRFPPEASGYLHIGHAKAALLNAHYQVSFQGKLIMRFDDTNPEKEKEDFEKVILEDVAMLQIKPDLFTYTSDHFELLLQKCESLLKSGVAYVDDTDPETMKNEREQRLDSKNRNNDVTKNWSMWEEMKKGAEFGKSCCVRAKIDMKSDNGCLRDPTLYRCKSMSHPRTGDKYNVYPTYDFACPIVDSVEGVTHALRTTEYHDRDEQYFWILEVLKMRKPYIYEYSRLNMTNTVLSKRKLTWFVQQGIVEGWDDPRMPTVRGVLRRGLTVEGLKQFIVAQGSSRSVVVMEWDKIWAFNKKVIDPVAPRYNAVEKDSLVNVVVEGATSQILKVAKHPKNPELGMKDLYVGPQLFVDRADADMMKVGENVTFINWGNLLVTDIKRGSSGEIIKVFTKLNVENKDYKKTLKVTWVLDHQDQPLVPCKCVYFDHLISKPVLGKDDDFKAFMNENTRIEVPMLGDSLLANVQNGDIIQIQRKGFFICDEPYDKTTLRHTSKEGKLVLFSIPDGSKDLSSLPAAVRNLKEMQISEKEKLSSLKGKESEKSPQDEQKDICDGKGDFSTVPLESQIEEQGNLVRQLKSQKADKTEIDAQVQILLKLKKDYKNYAGKDWKPPVNNSKPPAITNKTSKAENKDLSNSSLDKKEVIELDGKIKSQGNIVRELKSQKAEKSIIDDAVKQLLLLKADFKKCTNIDWKPDLVTGVVNTVSEKKSPVDSDLYQQVKVQGELVRKLKSDKADKSIIDTNVKQLLKLKEEYKVCTGMDWKPDLVPCVVSAPSEINSPVDSDLYQQVKEQGELVRKLKLDKADKSIIDTNVKKLLKLKEEYKACTGMDWKPDAQTKCSVVEKTSKPEYIDEVQSLQQSYYDLNEQIKLQGDVVRKLKSEKADKSTIEVNVKKLLKLKEDFKVCTGKDWKPDTKLKEDAVSQNQLSNSGSNKKNPENKHVNPKVSSVTAAETESNLKKITRLGLEARKEENLAEWYSQVLTKAEMIEYYDISGCYILRPWAYSIWEAIQKFFDTAIKSLGVTNCYFPMFVSSNALEKEKTHISDFAPEVAWVTKSGSSDLDKAIAIRPTSETVMYPSYAKWIRSHRDLPLKLNQWCNVVRWEFRNPQPFIRTREFLWQEGHTAFATKEEAENEVYTILDFYFQVYEHLLAIPIIRGKKTEKEKFAGADFTTTAEAYVPANGRGIQGATSHHLGQNFSKMFEIIYEDPDTSEKQFVYQNSWGLSTRCIGAMVMIHGDNTGLVIPPRVAAHQVVIVPCGITASLKESDKDLLMVKCSEFESVLRSANITVKLDSRDNYSPGWKFNYWELKGVPIRVELGPKDIKKNQFVAVRRDTGEKITYNIDSAPNSVLELLDNIHENLFAQAKKSRDDHLCVTYDWSDFCNKLEKRFIIQSPFCGEISCEDNIKKDSARNADENLEPGAPSMGAKSLCIPFEQPAEIKPTTKCIHPKCSQKPKYFTLFGRSY